MLLALFGLFLLNLLLRVFYIRYDFVNGDEGVRALTGVRMLEGARLYADVVTDKPPGASLFYAAMFAVFGRSMKAVHLAATVWNFGTSLIVYLIASRFFNKRLALWATLFFIYFSTNYFTQDMMAANTELLMALPYSLAFYAFVRTTVEEVPGNDSRRGTLLVAAGVLTGLAALFKQIGVLNLIFFFLYEALVVWRSLTERHANRIIPAWRAIKRLSLIASGFLLVIGAFVLWLASISALHDFWRNAVVLNMFYIDSEPLGLWIKFMLGRGLGYVFFNAILWGLAGLAVWRSVRGLREKQSISTDRAIDLQLRFDLTIVLWAAVSLIAVVMSGRFYGHYFFPTLPALSLLAARGWCEFIDKLRTTPHRLRAGIVVMAMILLFLIGLIRCHHRTAVLAYETVTGQRTHWSEDWGMTRREHEAQAVSRFVLDRIAPGSPLYIWGYAHDVFWRTQCRPASRYLTPYYIDGRFADAEASVPSSGEHFRREAAENLLEDLRRNRPLLILDIEGGFRSLPYEDLVRYVANNYREIGDAGVEPGRPFRALELQRDSEISR